MPDGYVLFEVGRIVVIKLQIGQVNRFQVKLPLAVAIGIYAAKWVHNTRDFAVAGRRMPMLPATRCTVSPPHGNGSRLLLWSAPYRAIGSEFRMMTVFTATAAHCVKASSKRITGSWAQGPGCKVQFAAICYSLLAIR